MIVPFNRKPIHILCSEDLPQVRVNLAISALTDLTKFAHMTLETQVVRGGRANKLLALGRRHGRDGDEGYQLHATKMLDKIFKDLKKDDETKEKRRFELLLTDDDIYAPETNFIFGIGQEHVGCVFSFKRFLGLTKNQAPETAKTVLMHEMGHVFSLPARTEAIEESLGTHCTNQCLMRQGLSLPAMVKITKSRLAGNVLCKLCITDLINYFWTLDSPQPKYCRNPKSYSEMSTTQLKKEERAILEAIDDGRYFGHNPQKIAFLEEELLLVRKALSLEDNVFFPNESLPEAAIHARLLNLTEDLKTSKSLEAVARNAIEISAYRRKALELEETIEKIKPILKGIVAGRQEISLVESLVKTTNMKLTSALQERDAIDPKRNELSIARREQINNQINDLVSAAYKHRQTLEKTNEQILAALITAIRYLGPYGQGISLAQRPISVPTQVIYERPAPVPVATELPTELTNTYTQLSTDPAIAALQNRLRFAVEELTIAIEDHSPPFILRPLETKVANLHAEIQRRIT